MLRLRREWDSTLMAGTLNVVGNQTGIATGTNAVQTSLVMSESTWSTQLVVYSTSTQIFPITGGIQGNALLIEGPPGNTVTINIKGTEGDTGIFLNPVGPTLLNLPSPNQQMWITTGAGTIPPPGITVSLL
jgi:hypothetical protein